MSMNILRDRRFSSAAVRRAMMLSAATAFVSGCLGSGATAPAGTPATPAASYLEPVPLETRGAKIASVNSELGFVVVDFTSQPMPALGTRLNVYRGGKRVGVVRITEPVHAPLATADVVEGEVRVGDEAR
jgi:hypothetical protein